MTDTFELMALALRIWALFLIAGLLILTLLLWFKPLRRALGRFGFGSSGSPPGGKEAPTTAPAPLALPASPPSPFPSLAEQQAVFERLAGLPQFVRLKNGSLVEWSTGATLSPCDCRRANYPTPHLMLRWPADQRGIGIVSQRALTALLNYHLAWARRLETDPDFALAPDAASSIQATGPATATGATPSLKGGL